MSKNKDNSYNAIVEVLVAPKCPTVRERLASEGVEDFSMNYACGGTSCGRVRAEDMYSDTVWKVSRAYGWTSKRYRQQANSAQAEFVCGRTSVVVSFSVDK